MDIVKTFLDLALVGGEWVLYLLILSSVLSIAVMIQKTIYIYKNRIHWEEFTEMLTGFLNRDDPEAALDYVRQQSAPASRVIEAGLQNLEKGPEAVEEMMIAKKIAEKFKMENKLVILGTLGNNAPFIGLFGTVLGIIKAFHDLSVAENSNPSVVMAGVSEALVATAVGLDGRDSCSYGLQLLSTESERSCYTNGSCLENIDCIYEERIKTKSG